jgi:hypothetical protein
MSNMQMGTRGVSSGDLTRLKRLRGSGYDFNKNKLDILRTNKDIHPTPFPQFGYPPNFHLPREMGSSRIRRTASGWTGYKAFLSADQVTQSQSLFTDDEEKIRLNNGKVLTATKLCNCSSTYNVEKPYINPKKQGLCIKCVHDPKWQVTK